MGNVGGGRRTTLLQDCRRRAEAYDWNCFSGRRETRFVLLSTPTTAVLTTNTVQLTIDLATLIRGKGDSKGFERARGRARLTFPSVAGFIAGCAPGSFLEVHFGLRALVLPVVLAWIAVPLGEYAPQAIPATKTTYSADRTCL